MERTALTHAMARVPGPVTVVTTIDGTGKRWGFTANSFSSVSLDPPLILVCLNKTASTHEAFTSADRFLINVLAHGQDAVARRFAQSGVDRFAAGDMKTCELGLPGSPGACARVACSMYSIVDAGDHSILIGRVVDTYADDRTPLVYFNRAFAYPAAAAEARIEEPVKVLHLADW
ncbi:flavin reductase family protein [Streptomyces sp. NPDC093591]|uniref:flavin reductase family protein n=1 Tax=Streptomyces sp. NPDC093591 TaxID=3366044 RepID=UPI003815B659